MTTSKLSVASFVLALSAVGFVGFQPEADAACQVNVGGYCEGTCDVNVLSTCWSNGSCDVNVVATCGEWDGSSGACILNAGLATCTGSCALNAGDAGCSAGSCFANAGVADCSGWCAVNAGSATCSGGCLANVGASACDSTYCAGDPICFLWGCTVNAVLAECHDGGHCLVNVASDCWGGCTANVGSISTYRVVRSVVIDMGCGPEGSCTVNLAARCDGACTVNAALARCEPVGACAVNVIATCQALGGLLP